ncbi:hypothetical protein [Parvularcula sp. LCG005]|uniref:hypothetical protein n=1 Tax=Parvularcula sp. LCG005 TaxID=3078805 RepID=UPI0029429C2E|nr:hypothetical protein [Parvularcula sp. LCG005]WOI52716.1 hypothetical protein RUI03_11220 [Parvularcula sp. LCG005]
MQKTAAAKGPSLLRVWAWLLTILTVMTFLVAAAGSALSYWFEPLWFFLAMPLLATWVLIAAIGLILGGLRMRRRWWLGLLPFALFFSIAYFGHFATDPIDRLIFEARSGAYEKAVKRMESGASAEEICQGFRYCGVNVDAKRIAFYHPEFYDKYIAFVYDPSGDYSRISAETDIEAYRGELVPGVVMFCKPVKEPYYRCYFS